MTPSVRLHQLYILRSQVDLLIAMEEVETPPAAAQDGPPECPHPQEKRRASHNMGQDPEFICLACGQTVKGTV